MAELSSMQNIGKEMERKLKSVGIETAEDLISAGSKEAYFRIKLRYSNVCLVHLYVLQGAIDGIKYNMLSENVRKELRAFSEKL